MTDIVVANLTGTSCMPDCCIPQGSHCPGGNLELRVSIDVNGVEELAGRSLYYSFSSTYTEFCSSGANACYNFWRWGVAASANITFGRVGYTLQSVDKYTVGPGPTSPCSGYGGYYGSGTSFSGTFPHLISGTWAATRSASTRTTRRSRRRLKP